MKPSELLLPTEEWLSLTKPNDPMFRAWLDQWEYWVSSAPVIPDEELRLIRYGHYLGWFAAWRLYRQP